MTVIFARLAISLLLGKVLIAVHFQNNPLLLDELLLRGGRGGPRIIGASKLSVRVVTGNTLLQFL